MNYVDSIGKIRFSFFILSLFSFILSPGTVISWGGDDAPPDPWAWHPEDEACLVDPKDNGTCDGSYVPEDKPLVFFVLGICNGKEPDAKRTQKQMRQAWSQGPKEGIGVPTRNELRATKYTVDPWIGII